jgi:hypothetical protein
LTRRPDICLGMVKGPPGGAWLAVPWWALRLVVFGGVLLSHALAGAVPLALVGLASGFGMGPGVSPPLSPPKLCETTTRGVVFQSCRVDAGIQVLWVSPRPISTSQLGNTLLCVHFWPINPVVFRGPYPTRGGRSHLGTGFPLRCLQRLSLPNVANQPCSWRNNWHTRGSSVPVLSY